MCNKLSSGLLASDPLQAPVLSKPSKFAGSLASLKLISHA